MAFFTSGVRRAISISAAAAAVAAGSIQAVLAATTINGAGATFPAPLYQRYAAELNKQGIQFNYQAIGSGGGIRQFTAGTVDVAGSDIFPTPAQRSQMDKGRGVIVVPTAGGAIAVPYNLSGVSNLKLSRAALGGIFSGDIKNWSDPAIKAANPGVNLPNTPIKLVVRSDSSGTSNIFSTHVAAISGSFKNKVGASSTPNWKGSVLRGKGNPGVAALVKQTAGSIGYVESAFAEQNNLKAAQVQNKAGRYVAPTVAEANKALSTVGFASNFQTAGSQDPRDGYPIVGVTYLMAYQKYPNAAKAQAVEKMLTWILRDGQKINPSLGYTAIPSSVAQRAIQAASQVAAR